MEESFTEPICTVCLLNITVVVGSESPLSTMMTTTGVIRCSAGCPICISCLTDYIKKETTEYLGKDLMSSNNGLRCVLLDYCPDILNGHYTVEQIVGAGLISHYLHAVQLKTEHKVRQDVQEEHLKTSRQGTIHKARDRVHEMLCFSCPNCRATFSNHHDPSECSSLLCPSCKISFCAFCPFYSAQRSAEGFLQTHKHIVRCPNNPTPMNMYHSIEVWNEFHNQQRAKKIYNFLKKELSPSEQKELLDLVDHELKQIDYYTFVNRIKTNNNVIDNPFVSLQQRSEYKKNLIVEYRKLYQGERINMKPLETLGIHVGRQLFVFKSSVVVNDAVYKSGFEEEEFEGFQRRITNHLQMESQWINGFMTLKSQMGLSEENKNHSPTTDLHYTRTPEQLLDLLMKLHYAIRFFFGSSLLPNRHGIEVYKYVISSIKEISLEKKTEILQFLDTIGQSLKIIHQFLDIKPTVTKVHQIIMKIKSKLFHSQSISCTEIYMIEIRKLCLYFIYIFNYMGLNKFAIDKQLLCTSYYSICKSMQSDIHYWLGINEQQQSTTTTATGMTATGMTTTGMSTRITKDMGSPFFFLLLEKSIFNQDVNLLAKSPWSYINSIYITMMMTKKNEMDNDDKTKLESLFEEEQQQYTKAVKEYSMLPLPDKFVFGYIETINIETIISKLDMKNYEGIGFASNLVVVENPTDLTNIGRKHKFTPSTIVSLNYLMSNKIAILEAFGVSPTRIATYDDGLHSSGKLYRNQPRNNRERMGGNMNQTNEEPPDNINDQPEILIRFPLMNHRQNNNNNNNDNHDDIRIRDRNHDQFENFHVVDAIVHVHVREIVEKWINNSTMKSLNGFSQLTVNEWYELIMAFEQSCYQRMLKDQNGNIRTYYIDVITRLRMIIPLELPMNLDNSQLTLGKKQQRKDDIDGHQKKKKKE